jgi:hypothetical protein
MIIYLQVILYILYINKKYILFVVGYFDIYLFIFFTILLLICCDFVVVAAS